MSTSSLPRSGHATSLALALALAATGCANTKISRIWSDEELQKDRYERVMVLVLAASHARRETAEDRIYDLLTREGVAAVRAYDLLPEGSIESRDAIREAVQKSGVDSLLAVRITGVDRETEVQQGREQWVPQATFTDYYGYVSTSYGLYRRPEVYKELVVTAETTLWDAATARMVWACQSDSTSLKETITTAEFTDDFAKVVVKQVRPYLRAK